MRRPKFSPLTRRKLKRFREIKRGYYSFLLLLVLIVGSLFLEFFINNRALLVRYEGQTYFPILSDRILPGTTFGLPYAYETNYRELDALFEADPEGSNWVLLPLVPYNPLENSLRPGVLPLYQPPDWGARHFLGTDAVGRDVLARLAYAFRNLILASCIFVAIVYAMGTLIGCAMGYFGGRFDLLAQRFIEIWSNVPVLYLIIILSALLRPELWMLVLLMAAFSWMGITYYLRTETYREKARDYVASAQVAGAGPLRIIFRHILPNVLSILVTFLPFTVTAFITSLTALDYLGFGLPPPTPSWGDLLRQGTRYLEAPWMVLSTFCTLVIVLTLITFVGEAIREAFDPRKFTLYR